MIWADGKSGSTNQFVARDALGFNLHYFVADYDPISATVQPFAQPAGNTSHSGADLQTSIIKNSGADMQPCIWLRRVSVPRHEKCPAIRQL